MRDNTCDWGPIHTKRSVCFSNIAPIKFIYTDAAADAWCKWTIQKYCNLFGAISLRQPLTPSVNGGWEGNVFTRVCFFCPRGVGWGGAASSQHALLVTWQWWSASSGGGWAGVGIKTDPFLPPKADIPIPPREAPLPQILPWQRVVRILL